MKFTSTITALVLVAAVTATALPNAEAKKGHRCGWVGQACGKAKRVAIAEPDVIVKRAAEAFAEALAVADDAPANPELAARCDMGACYEAKMMTRHLASIVAETAEDPTAFYDSLDLEDETTTENLKREARHRCGWVGQACGKVKRDLEDRHADPEAAHRCGFVGQACGKLRRAAEAVAEAVAEADPAHRCGFVGQACGKAKRDALALAAAADMVLEKL